jgi:hypothetical protein
VQKVFKTSSLESYKLVFKRQRKPIITENVDFNNKNISIKITAKNPLCILAETVDYKAACCTFKPDSGAPVLSL